MVFVMTGAALLIGAVIWNLVLKREVSRPESRPNATRAARSTTHRWAGATVAGIAVVAMAVTVPTVQAQPSGVTSEHVSWDPDSYNGYRVYVSPPRHIDSGSRGECGWEENINGRHWSVHSAAWSHGGDGGFRARGYQVTVGANVRDDNWAANRTASNNWGASVHLPTHTNALHGCSSGGGGDYFLAMYNGNHTYGYALANNLVEVLGPSMPGGNQMWEQGGLGELQANANHQAYAELFFHDTQSHVNWFQAGGGDGDGVTFSWRYGSAVDTQLGFPR